jgi:hypothetical protein
MSEDVIFKLAILYQFIYSVRDNKDIELNDIIMELNKLKNKGIFDNNITITELKRDYEIKTYLDNKFITNE